MGEMASKLTIKTAEQYHWHSSSVFIVKLSETYFTPFSSICWLGISKCSLGCIMVIDILHNIYWSRKHIELTTKQIHLTFLVVNVTHFPVNFWFSGRSELINYKTSIILKLDLNGLPVKLFY